MGNLINCGNTLSCEIYQELERHHKKKLSSIMVLDFDGEEYWCNVRTSLKNLYDKSKQYDRGVFNLNVPCHIESSRTALHRIEKKLENLKCLERKD